MNRGPENNEDEIAIVDEEVINNVSLPNVIRDERPKRHFIEPVLFFLFIGFSLFETIVQNTLELQLCTSVLNVPSDQCLNTTVQNKVKLQQFTSTFSILRSCIEVSVPSVISFFVGPWSDTYGRKPLILSALVGYSITYGLWTFGSSIPSLHPIVFLFFSIPLAFSGGGTSMILGTFCYVCDVTNLETRGARLGRLQASLFMGSLIGTQLCPILKPYGSTVVFGVASLFVYLALIYAYFGIEESIIPSQIELNSVNKNPFNMQHVRGLYDACYTKQTPRVRFTIGILIAILTCSLINIFGESGVMYLFLQRIFSDWKESDLLNEYTQLSSFIIIVNAIGAFGGTWLFCYKLKLDDLLVLSVAAFLRLVSAVLMIFGSQIWHIYFAKMIACSLGLSGPLIRSFLSRIVAKDELGKVFSLLASTESTTPLFATLAYNTLYQWTLVKFPGAVFYLSAVLLLIMLGFITLLVELYVPSPQSSQKRNTVSSTTPSINVD